MTQGPLSLFVHPLGIIDISKVGQIVTVVPDDLEHHVAYGPHKIMVFTSTGTQTLVGEDAHAFSQAFIEYHELVVCAAPPDVKVLREQIANLHATIEQLRRERNQLRDENQKLQVAAMVARGSGIP